MKKFFLLLAFALFMANCGGGIAEIEYNSTSSEIDKEYDDEVSSTDEFIIDDIDEGDDSNIEEDLNTFTYDDYQQDDDVLEVDLSTTKGNHTYIIGETITFSIFYLTQKNDIEKVLFDYNDDDVIDFEIYTDGDIMETRSKTFTETIETNVTVYVVDKDGYYSKDSFEITIKE